MTKRFTHYERKRIEQSVLECQIQGLNRDEMRNYVIEKLGRTVSARHIDYVRAHSDQRTHKKLESLKKHRYAYVDKQFRHIEEIEANQQFLYDLRHNNPDKPFLQKTCTDSIVDMTIVKANFYAQLPDLSGSGVQGDIFEYDTAQSESLEEKQEQPSTGYRNPQAKF